MKVVLPIAFGLLFVIAGGCGKRAGRERLAIEGTVSYAGKPLEYGKIAFEPMTPKLPMASGKVQSGRYVITSERGPAAGDYLVRIKGFRKRKDPKLDRHPYLGDDQEVGVVTEQYLPQKHNVDSAINVEITSDGNGTYNFDLEQ